MLGLNRTLGVILCWITLMSTGSQAWAVMQEVEQEPPASSQGEIVQVTLFRNTALVTREIPVPPADGDDSNTSREITVGGLPEQLILDSGFAEGNDAVAIRGVRILQEPIDEAQREDVRELETKMQELREEVARLQNQQNVQQQNMRSLDQMVQFTHDASQKDLNRGTIQASALTDLVTFAAEKRAQWSEESFDLNQQIQKTQEELQQTQRRHNQLASGEMKTRYLAKIFIETTGEDPAPIRFSYSVGGCNWSPQYSFEARSDSDKISMRYGAVIQQFSGEDWSNVALTLSTASPSVNAAGPTLTPLRVTAVDPSGQSAGAPADDLGRSQSKGGFGDGQQPQRMPNQMAQQLRAGQAQGDATAMGNAILQNQMKSLRKSQRQLEESVSGQSSQREDVRRNTLLNTLAGQMQEVELLAAARHARGLATDAADEVASQTYPLDSRITLKSRREQQLADIRSAEFTGDLYHVAIPLLSSFAYREAELVNDLDIGLLSGPASMYLDDRFVGMMPLPSTASGQRFWAGFGADGQVRTRRELLDKEETQQGGNQKSTFHYRLVVANFKDQPVDIRLMDRIPLSDQAKQTSVTLGSVDQPLSDNKLYLRIQRPMNLLRWDVTVPAGSHGSDAMDLDYDYTIELDRSQELSVRSPSESSEQLLMDSFGPGMGGMGGMGMGGGVGQ